MVALHQDRLEQASEKSGIKPGYRHYPKQITAREPFTSPGISCKWYDLGFAGIPVSDELHDEARATIENEVLAGTMDAPGGIGFVILHDCGDVVFLLTGLWCNNNELWESVFIKRTDLAGSFRPLRVPGDIRPTYCVWELGIVAHEARSWSRYLASDRSEFDLNTYFAERATGETV